MQSFVVNSQDKWKVNHLPDTHLRKHSTLPARGERERERERERDTHRDRERDRQTERQRETETHRERGD